MTLDKPHFCAGTTHSASSQSLLSKPLPMSQDVSSPPRKRSRQLMQFNRDMSWQVASNLFVSFKYAWTGICYAFLTQRNFRIHVVIGSLAIGLGVFLHVSLMEIAVIVLTIGAVLAMELLNTAIESLVDLTVQQTYHDLAKIAKDCAAGAVLVSSFAAIAIAGCLLVPPLIERIHSSF